MGQVYGINRTPNERLDGMLFRLRERFNGVLAPLARHTPSGSPVDALALGALRVLVAEDEPVHQLITRARLADFGVTPMLAMDGGEAVALACELQFDFILMDLQMPVLDGLTATKQIRRFELEHERPRVPVVAYTSCTCSNESFVRDFGIDAVLEKPCSANALRECLTKWCPA